MTTFNYGDVVLVPFPFTDQTSSKNRPAVIISSSAYNKARNNLIVIAISSQFGSPCTFGDLVISDWKNAGLVKPSIVKPILFSIKNTLIIRKLGQLQPDDQITLRNSVHSLFG